ncbi:MULTISPECIES: response regulator [Methylomonas]|uniref:response regulator n=1 Tax=Methylomonas TaxID=416 RepID=UPI001232E16A|nr:response regulator [Methylomonas rhizoryzae]
MIRVLLVDDHELVRSGIEALLNAVEDISVVAVCDCGEKALKQVEDTLPDVVLMDVNMPGMGGFEACRRILMRFPKVKIIGLSVHNGGPVPHQLLKLGVGGFVSKASPVSEMVAAIRTVMDGKRYLCQEVASNLVFEAIESEEISPFFQLSQREAEVTQMILRGKSIQEIAGALALSDKTVNTYRYRLYSKLKVKNDVELTRLALKFNYFESF